MLTKSDEAAVAEDSEPTTLNEFCMMLSQSDRRIELISAFEASERVAGVVKDHVHAFRARFIAFANRPV
jgi:hypothetical protein